MAYTLLAVMVLVQEIPQNPIQADAADQHAMTVVTLVIILMSHAAIRHQAKRGVLVVAIPVAMVVEDIERVVLLAQILSLHHHHRHHHRRRHHLHRRHHRRLHRRHHRRLHRRHHRHRLHHQILAKMLIAHLVFHVVRKDVSVIARQQVAVQEYVLNVIKRNKLAHPLVARILVKKLDLGGLVVHAPEDILTVQPTRGGTAATPNLVIPSLVILAVEIHLSDMKCAINGMRQNLMVVAVQLKDADCGNHIEAEAVSKSLLAVRLLSECLANASKKYSYINSGDYLP